jgi:hypothetical protein
VEKRFGRPGTVLQPNEVKLRTDEGDASCGQCPSYEIAEAGEDDHGIHGENGSSGGVQKLDVRGGEPVQEVARQPLNLQIALKGTSKLPLELEAKTLAPNLGSRKCEEHHDARQDRIDDGLDETP